MNNGFEYIDIILLAMIAGFIFLRLRGILGKKTGFEGKIPAEIKKEVIQDFNSHPVTQEIAQGPKGMSSHLLGGRGNLFGFLGFEQGSKPVMIIRDALRNSFEVNRQKMRVTSLKNNVFTVEFDVNVPTAQEIDSISPLPWTTQSWVKGIEKGITNYSQTIFQPRKGKKRSF